MRGLLSLLTIFLLLATFILTSCYKSYPYMDETDAGRPETVDASHEPTADPHADLHDSGTPDIPPDPITDISWDVPEGVTVPDVRYDTAYDTSYDLGPADASHEELPPVVTSSTCGDGVLDPGEECDDRNRLNGDGCDWLCRRGDGDPPPPPDSIPPYVPSGPPVFMPEFDGDWPWGLERLPLVWTGSEYAVAVMARHEDESKTIRMRRFTRDGTPRGPDWIFDLKSLLDGVDLAWTGSEYGLFFHDQYRGIFLLRISSSGEPMGQPINVEPDPQARAPAADTTSTGYILAWITEGAIGSGTITSWCGDWGGPRDTIRARLVGFDGSISGPPVLVEADAGGPPDVSAGSSSYGITAMINSSPSFPSCALRFVRLSTDLSSATYPGVLSDGQAGDVVWEDGRYIVGWTYMDTMEGDRSYECVARFFPNGALEGPPACNATAPYEYPYFTRIAAGDRGLALVFPYDSDQGLAFLRTGLNGIGIEPPRSVPGPICDPYTISHCHFGPHNTVWSVDGFGVAALADISEWDLKGLFLWTFEAAD